MEEIEDLPMATYQVTCSTESCENFGIVLTVEALLTTPLVICGPCGAQLDPTLESEMDLEPE